MVSIQRRVNEVAGYFERLRHGSYHDVKSIQTFVQLKRPAQREVVVTSIAKQYPTPKEQ